MSRSVSRSEFARIAKVSPAAITKACKAGVLKPACEADRIDLDHAAARGYLASRGVNLGKAKPAKAPTPKTLAVEKPPSAPTKTRRSGKNSKLAPTGHRPEDDPNESEQGVTEDLGKLADLTLRQLIDEHGTDRKFRDWLEARKKIEDTKAQELKNLEAEGSLIAREMVRTHVMAALEQSNIRLLRDAPKTITQRIYAAAQSGTPPEEAERVVRELIGSILRPVQDTAARRLRETPSGGAT